MNRKHLFLYLLPIFALTYMSICASDEGDTWHGTWDTNWRNGGATMYLQQNGNEVSGYYEPYNGKITATAGENGSLKGQWVQPQSSGDFQFLMSSDQETFSGNFGSGEWWNGLRINTESIAPDHSTNTHENPREVMRQFLTAGNALSSGDNNYLDNLLASVELPNEFKNALYRERGNLAKSFFDLISHTTLRVFAFSAGPTGNTYQREAFSELNNFNFSLEFIKNKNGWKLIVPDKNKLNKLKADLIEAGVYRAYNPQAHHQLDSPRATLRTFHEGFSDWDNKGKERVLGTINFSQISEKVIKWEGPVSAEYLKRVLDRSGHSIWQEIPNQLDKKTAYVHFDHPKGKVVIEAVEHEGQTIWQFTPDTIKNIRDLHDAIENIPIPEATSPYKHTAFFFSLRDIVIKAPGPWTTKFFDIEIWQWFGTTCLLLLSWSIADRLRKLSNKVAHYVIKKLRHMELDTNLIIGIPVLLIILGSTWGYTLFIFGIPDYLFTHFRLLSEILISVGVMWLVFSLVSEVAEYLMQMADDTNSVTDDIIVTLISSILKIAIIVSSAMWLADILSIPYQTVVAGLGIGGIAFAIAARDTIANFFGSAVILTDRPFGPGDLVSINEHIGFIESVGLRSTRIRDESDALIFIPNSIVSKDVIVNCDRRDRTLVDESIPLDSNTNTRDIARVSEKIHDMLQSDKMIDGRFLVVGLNNFAPGAIHLRLRFYIREVDRKLYLEQKHRLLTEAIALVESLNIQLASVNIPFQETEGPRIR